MFCHKGVILLLIVLWSNSINGPPHIYDPSRRNRHNSLETQNKLWVPVELGIVYQIFFTELGYLNYCYNYSRLPLVNTTNSIHRNIEKIISKVWQRYLSSKQPFFFKWKFLGIYKHFSAVKHIPCNPYSEYPNFSYNRSN